MRLHEQIAKGSAIYEDWGVRIYNAELRTSVGPYGKGAKFDYIIVDFSNSEVTFFQRSTQNASGYINIFGTSLILDTLI